MIFLRLTGMRLSLRTDAEKMNSEFSICIETKIQNGAKKSFAPPANRQTKKLKSKRILMLKKLVEPKFGMSQ